MIRLPPMKELETHGSAVDKAAMAAWAERHGQRGGSKKSTLDEHEQQTLLRWVERNQSRFVHTEAVRRGCFREYRLEFGAYDGCSVREMLSHARAGAASSNRQFLQNPPPNTPRPGPYLLWIAGCPGWTGPSRRFEWTFPQHVKLFCALGAAEFAGATLSGSGANVYALKLSDFPRTRYDAYVASVLTPHDDDTNPYAPRGGGGAEGDGGGGGSGSSESRSATAAGGGSGGSGGGGDDDDDDATGDADPPWKPLDSIDRHENGVPKEQQHFFHEITEDMTSGHAPCGVRPPTATPQPPRAPGS